MFCAIEFFRFIHLPIPDSLPNYFLVFFIQFDIGARVIFVDAERRPLFPILLSRTVVERLCVLFSLSPSLGSLFGLDTKFRERVALKIFARMAGYVSDKLRNRTICVLCLHLGESSS